MQLAIIYSTVQFKPTVTPLVNPFIEFENEQQLEINTEVLLFINAWNILHEQNIAWSIA